MEKIFMVSIITSNPIFLESLRLKLQEDNENNKNYIIEYPQRPDNFQGEFPVFFILSRTFNKESVDELIRNLVHIALCNNKNLLSQSKVYIKEVNNTIPLL